MDPAGIIDGSSFDPTQNQIEPFWFIMGPCGLEGGPSWARLELFRIPRGSLRYLHGSTLNPIWIQIGKFMDLSWILDEAFSAPFGTSWLLCGIIMGPERTRGPTVERIGSLLGPCWARLDTF